MTKARQFISAPRIELVLVPDSQSDNVNVPATLFDIWLVLHVPDGLVLETVPVDDGPFDREDAVMKLCEIWDYIGQKYAEPQAKQRVGASRSATC
jgi:hypothetical protein